MSILRLVMSTVNTLALIALGVSRLNWPSEELWANKTPWLVGALVLSSVWGTIQAFVAERGEKRRRKKLEEQKNVRDALTVGLVDLGRHYGVEWHEVGVRAFITRKGWLHTRHELIEFVKLNSAARSGIKWIDGKGIVGQCWQSNGERQFENLAAWQNYSADTWKAVASPDNYELSFAEMKLMRERYGVIAAVPIRSDSADASYIGCVTMDTDRSPTKVPIKEDVWRALGSTAVLVRLAMNR